MANDKAFKVKNDLDVGGNVTVAGNLTVEGSTISLDNATVQTFTWGDNDKAVFGDGSDLQIYHDGTTSKIDGNVSFTNNVTLSGGTANGVAYLNGSKVLTSGSALTFDGTTLGVTGGISIDSSSSGTSVFSILDNTANSFQVKQGGNSYISVTTTNGSEIVELGNTTTNPTVRAANAFQVNGNTTLGDASTDTVQVNGYMGVGVAPNAAIGIYTNPSSLTGTGQYGVAAYVTSNSAATTETVALVAQGATAAAAYTTTNLYGIKLNNATKGAGSTITNQHGVYINDQTQGTNNYGITSLVSSGTNKWNIYASGTAANYFAGNVGIGTSSPLAKLHVETQPSGAGITPSINGDELVLENNSNCGLTIGTENLGSIFFGKAADNDIGGIGYSMADNSMRFTTNAAERLRIDSSGNLGLGVTPSAWGSGYKGFQLSTGLSLMGSSVNGNFSANCYFDGTNWRYVQNTVANNFYANYANNGSFVWATAPSGTAGNAISFTQAMTLHASGGLSLGNTSDPGAGTLNVNGVTVGRGAGASLTNTAVGASALAANTTGIVNVAVGQQALLGNTTGSYNVAVGRNNLYTNTTGSNNIAIGFDTLYYNNGDYNVALGGTALGANTTGNNNTALGANALFSNTTASNVTAVGYQAGYGNTTGTEGTAIGYRALYSNTTGSSNVAVGAYAAYLNTTGVANTAVGYGAGLATTSGNYNTSHGYQALYSNTTASNNTAVGYQAGYSNTTGQFINALGHSALLNNTTGWNNNGFGYSALRSNTSGNYNSAFGDGALYSNTTASNNTAVGYQAGYSNTTAVNNTFVGYQAGRNNVTGRDATHIGYAAGKDSTGGYNTLVGAYAGYALTTGTSNTFVGPSSTGVASAGGTMTTGSKNTILGGYNGNQGGLDIRTLSNYLVLSDGDGNPRIYHNGTTVVIPNLPTSSAGLPSGGLYVAAGVLMVA